MITASENTSQRDEVLALRSNGYTYSEISNITKVPKSTVGWICTTKNIHERAVVKRYNWDEIQMTYNEAQSIRKTANKHKMSKRSIEKGIARGQLQTIAKQSLEINDLLVNDRPKTSRGYLKRRLIKEGLLRKQCYKCGIGTIWEGEPLVLQLEHKNGDNKDNRLTNLELLCPNCHSQTPTFCGKNIKKKKLIALEPLPAEPPAAVLPLD